MAKEKEEDRLRQVAACAAPPLMLLRSVETAAGGYRCVCVVGVASPLPICIAVPPRFVAPRESFVVFLAAMSSIVTMPAMNENVAKDARKCFFFFFDITIMWDATGRAAAGAGLEEQQGGGAAAGPAEQGRATAAVGVTAAASNSSSGLAVKAAGREYICASIFDASSQSRDQNEGKVDVASAGPAEGAIAVCGGVASAGMRVPATSPARRTAAGQPTQKRRRPPPLLAGAESVLALSAESAGTVSTGPKRKRAGTARRERRRRRPRR